MDLREPLATLTFVASNCGDLPELQELRDILATKYGREFITAVQELRPDCHVNKAVLETFSSQDPSEAVKQALLVDIAAEYNVLPKLKAVIAAPAEDLPKHSSPGLDATSKTTGQVGKDGDPLDATQKNRSRQRNETDGLSSGSSRKPVESNVIDNSSKLTRPTDSIGVALNSTAQNRPKDIDSGPDSRRRTKLRKSRKGREHTVKIDRMHEISRRTGDYLQTDMSDGYLASRDTFSEQEPVSGQEGKPCTQNHRRQGNTKLSNGELLIRGSKAKDPKNASTRREAKVVSISQEDDSDFSSGGHGLLHARYLKGRRSHRTKGLNSSDNLDAKLAPTAEHDSKQSNFDVKFGNSMMRSMPPSSLFISESLPSTISAPPQRPPPPPPPYRVVSLPTQSNDSPPVLPQRSSTLEPNIFREKQDSHVHPRLPQYEDLVARFAALKQKRPEK